MRSKRWDGKSGCAVEVTLSVMGACGSLSSSFT